MVFWSRPRHRYHGPRGETLRGRPRRIGPGRQRFFHPRIDNTNGLCLTRLLRRLPPTPRNWTFESSPNHHPPLHPIPNISPKIQLLRSPPPHPSLIQPFISRLVQSWRLNQSSSSPINSTIFASSKTCWWASTKASRSPNQSITVARASWVPLSEINAS